MGRFIKGTCSKNRRKSSLFLFLIFDFLFRENKRGEKKAKKNKEKDKKFENKKPSEKKGDEKDEKGSRRRQLQQYQHHVFFHSNFFV